MNNRGIIKVIDITGKMDNYVTLEEFMKKTEYKFSCDFNMAGKGIVSSDKVRFTIDSGGPHIYNKGRLWSKRKMIVYDQFSDSKKEEMYGQFREFLDIIEHYVEGIHAYKLVFPKAEGWSDVYMNTINDVFDMCLDESKRLYMKRHSPVGGKWRSLKRQSKFTSDTEGK